MISKTQFMNSLIGKPVVDALIQTLYNQMEDFPAIYQAYLDAIKKLREELGPEAKNEIKKYVIAIEQMCASNRYYAGTQGLRMNYDHFVNPMTPNCTWPQVDYDDYLRPYIAESLPLYQTAYRFKEKFEKKLPDHIESVIEAVTSYETALECGGIKLAHYYGYLMGNELLLHCVPGYHPDMVLDLRYTQMLEQYFGKRLSKDQWEDYYFLKEWKFAPIPKEDPAEVSLWREAIMKEDSV